MRLIIAFFCFTVVTSICAAFDQAAAGTYLYGVGGCSERIRVTRTGAFTLNSRKHGIFNASGDAGIFGRGPNGILVPVTWLKLHDTVPPSIDVTVLTGGRPFVTETTYVA